MSKKLRQQNSRHHIHYAVMYDLHVQVKLAKTNPYSNKHALQKLHTNLLMNAQENNNEIIKLR